MEQSELEVREERLRKLTDIRHSSESLIEKIGQVQVDLFNAPDKDLEKKLDTLNNQLSDAHRVIVDEIVHPYEEAVDELKENS